MAGHAIREVLVPFKLDEVFSHILRLPGVIASDLGDMSPVVVRRKGKVHRIDLTRSTDGIAAGVENAEPTKELDRTFGDVIEDHPRFRTLRRVESHVEGPIVESVCKLVVTASLGLILEVVDKELPGHLRCLRSLVSPAKC